MKFKQLLNKSTMVLKKHSPAILTGVGVIGLGATAYLAYKSREKVEEVIVEIEDAREAGEEINKVEVAKGIAEAVYLPVLVGGASVAAILLSYRIQSKRVTALASALVAQQAHNAFFEKKYKDTHGEEEYSKFMAPTEREEVVTVDGKGKNKVTSEEVRKELDKTIGQWYDESSEYLIDDHHYNIAYIDSVEQRLQTILFQRGHLLLNEVRDALGFERIRNGALLGWSSGDSFDIHKAVTAIQTNPDGAPLQIWVSWSRPRYIYDEVDFNGRYAI